MVHGHTFETESTNSAVHVTRVALPDHDTGGRVTIPDTELLFSARFTQSGSDLILTGADGHKVERAVPVHAIHRLELGKCLNTRAAPGGPEINQHDFA